MQDRVPLYPGRIILTPVAGQANTYDMVRADQPTQDGTPLNKATFWKDATAALFGLGVGSVPDDGFAILGKYAQHWWKRRTVTRTVDVELGELNTGQGAWIEGPNMDDTPYPIQYSEDLEVVGTSDVGLKNPKTLMLKYSTWETDVLTLREKYFYSTRGQKQLQYGASNLIPDNWSSSGGILTLNLRNFYTPKASVVRTDGPWEYVQSSNRSQYPDSGEQGGYEYEYLGIPFDNAVGAPKVEQISYIGTGGTAGHTNPVVIKTSFRPKFAFIISADRASSSDFTAFAVGSDKTPTFNYVNEFLGNWAFNLTSEKVIMMQFNDDSLKIADVLNRDVNTQCNSMGKTYVAIIFG